MRRLTLVAVLILAGCVQQPHGKIPAPDTRTDAELCERLGYVTGVTYARPNAVTNMQRAEFDEYYAQTTSIKAEIKGRIARQVFTLKPEQCAGFMQNGRQRYAADLNAKEHPQRSQWDKTIGG